MGRRYTNADEMLISAAQKISVREHAGVFDKNGDPYYWHPLAVATLARNAGEDAEVVALCFLHDVVEDTDRTLDDIRLELEPIVAQTGHYLDGIIDGLDAITHRPHEPRIKYWTRVRDHFYSRRAKQYDIIHNTWPERLDRLEPEDRARKVSKYSDAQDFLGYARTV